MKPLVTLLRQAALPCLSLPGNATPPELEEPTANSYRWALAQPASAHGNRGQGLFVAKTYMAKMRGTISVETVADGVCFRLEPQRVMTRD